MNISISYNNQQSIYKSSVLLKTYKNSSFMNYVDNLIHEKFHSCSFVGEVIHLCREQQANPCLNFAL